MNNTVEEWRPVVGYEGNYAVSNFGRIKNIKFDKILKTCKHISGTTSKRKTDLFYYRFSACCGGRAKTLLVHRVVAEAFYGECKKGLVVDHIDNNPLNNYAINLRYITVRENTIRGKSSQQRENKSSEYLGVSKSGNRFCSNIFINGKLKRLGSFLTEQEASEVYQRALLNA
jgi:hypothetical protein